MRAARSMPSTVLCASFAFMRYVSNGVRPGPTSTTRPLDVSETRRPSTAMFRRRAMTGSLSRAGSVIATSPAAKLGGGKVDSSRMPRPASASTT